MHISWPRRTALIASALVGVIGTALIAAPASATDPQDRILITAGQPNCVDYSEGKIWQTSLNFARARYRFCLVESADGSLVQPVVQVQFDWPIGDCSLSVGFPKSVEVSCPAGATRKRTIIKFQAYQSINNKPIVFRIPLTITRPELTMARQPELSDQNDIQRRVQCAGDFIRDRHASARQCQDHDIVPAVKVSDVCGQLSAGVPAVVVRLFVVGASRH